MTDCRRCQDKGSPCMAHDGVPGNWAPSQPVLPVEITIVEVLEGWDWIWGHPESILYWSAHGLYQCSTPLFGAKHSHE